MNAASQATRELQELAKNILDVIPLITRSIRTEMRVKRAAELSVPQFRVLGYVEWHTRVSLSAVAEHMGLTLPSMSKMVDGLVVRGFVHRTPDSLDRRRVAIQTTPKGREAWTAARQATCASMVHRLQGLGAAKRRELSHGLDTLRFLFSKVGDEPTPAGGEDGRS
jgi:DNA-binding MarR family transcriptional regulator